MACPFSEKIVAYVDEQLAVSESKAVEQHFKECGCCRKQLEETKLLLESIKKDAPSDDPNKEDFFLGVMAAVERPEKKHYQWPYFLAAGIAIAVLIPSAYISMNLRSDAGEFGARGDLDKSISALVDVKPLVVTGTRIQPVDEKTIVSAQDGLTFQYTNYFDEPLYFMAFAIDSRHDVHWFYPAYLSVTDDPSAVLLSNNTRDHLMPEIVSPENVPAGNLEIVILVSPIKYLVKQTEKKLTEYPQKSVMEIFPKCDLVRKWQLQYR